jgi:hypothetical protein
MSYIYTCASSSLSEPGGRRRAARHHSSSKTCRTVRGGARWSGWIIGLISAAIGYGQAVPDSNKNISIVRGTLVDTNMMLAGILGVLLFQSMR